MKTCDYMKEKKKTGLVHRFGQIANLFFGFINEHRSSIPKFLAIVVVLSVISVIAASKDTSEAGIAEFGSVKMATIPLAASSSQNSVISIPKGMVKANPFVPYRDISGTSTVSDVPAYNLIEPPEVINENSDAARVMDTIVSGILFDKFSPSAILNIEGNDYLVKKGDVVNNYKVVSIAQDSVTVQLGANVYKAGIGEILTEGNLNYNEVSNLNNRFGGVK